MDHEVGGDTNCNWCTRNDPLGLGKGLVESEIGGRAETMHTTGLLKSVRILRRVLET